MLYTVAIFTVKNGISLDNVLGNKNLALEVNTTFEIIIPRISSLEITIPVYEADFKKAPLIRRLIFWILYM